MHVYVRVHVLSLFSCDWSVLWTQYIPVFVGFFGEFVFSMVAPTAPRGHEPKFAWHCRHIHIHIYAFTHTPDSGWECAPIRTYVRGAHMTSGDFRHHQHASQTDRSSVFGAKLRQQVCFGF